MIYPPLGAFVPNLTLRMMGKCTGRAADLGVTGWGRTAQWGWLRMAVQQQGSQKAEAVPSSVAACARAGGNVVVPLEVGSAVLLTAAAGCWRTHACHWHHCCWSRAQRGW